MSREIFLHGVSSVINNTSHRRRIGLVDQVTREYGPSQGLKTVLSEKNAPEVTWDGDAAKTKEIIIAGKAIIVVSNHTEVIEPIVFLSALPERPEKDLFLFGDAGTQHSLGKELSKHILPIALPTRPYTQRRKERRQKFNNKWTEEAIRKLQEEQSAIYIAPNAGGGKWKRGIASLVESALEMDEAYLLMGYIQGSTSYEILKVLLNGNLKRNLYISEAINVHDLPIPEADKRMPLGDKEKHFRISAHLKTYYDEWATKMIPGEELIL